jgi:uncharacterized membrane protein
LSEQSKKCVYCPHNYSYFAVLFVLLVAVVGLIFFGVISFAFSGVGFSPWMVVLILVGTLLGSFINVPVAKLKSSVPIVREEFVNFFGLAYRVPRIEYSQKVTTLAVNVGGALIPAAVSIYLLAKAPYMTIILSIVGVIIVAAITRLIARPVKGVGIVTPAFIPPVAAAVVAILIAPAGSALVVAYVSGVMGTLIGADLLNLRRISNLGAPVASIGGAGTFDGVFLSGIIAVILAAL